MKRACTGIFGMPEGSDTTDPEIGHIWNAIQAAATSSGVDHRFILAIMMQESGGCVRVWRTVNGNGNPGLMQDHEGLNDCNPMGQGDFSHLVNPCPADKITGMVQEGVGGTLSGAGLAEYLNNMVEHGQAAGVASIVGSNAQVYYQAARNYNSGSVDYTNLDNGFSSDPCYASHIANRLTGWVWAAEGCS